MPEDTEHPGGDRPDQEKRLGARFIKIARSIGRLARLKRYSGPDDSIERLMAATETAQGLNRTMLSIIQAATQISVGHTANERGNATVHGDLGDGAWAVRLVNGGIGVTPMPYADQEGIHERTVTEMPSYWFEGMDLPVSSVRLKFATGTSRESELQINFSDDAVTSVRGIGAVINAAGDPIEFIRIGETKGATEYTKPDETEVSDLTGFIEGLQSAVETTALDQ